MSVEGHTVGRFFTWWPERRPAGVGEASKPTSHAQIGRFFNVSWGGDWPHSELYGCATPLSGEVWHSRRAFISCPQLAPCQPGTLQVLWVRVVGYTGCPVQYRKKKAGSEKTPPLGAGEPGGGYGNTRKQGYSLSHPGAQRTVPRLGFPFFISIATARCRDRNDPGTNGTYRASRLRFAPALLLSQPAPLVLRQSVRSPARHARNGE